MWGRLARPADLPIPLRRLGGWKRAAPCARPTGFVPRAGDAFPILTCASHSGTFGSVTGTTAGPRTFTPRLQRHQPDAQRDVTQEGRASSRPSNCAWRMKSCEVPLEADVRGVFRSAP